MPYYHTKRVTVRGDPCGMPFIQVRCPACGKVVGLCEGETKELRRAQPPSVFCSTDCVDAVPCWLENLLKLREEEPCPKN